MPSLHFGTSLLIGISVCCFGKQKWMRAIALLYPTIMGVTVIGTANHWIMDCLAGVLVIIVGWFLNWILLGLRPIEEWGFWLVRTKKPEEGDMRTLEPRSGD
jgi:hypothetical protein